MLKQRRCHLNNSKLLRQDPGSPVHTAPIVQEAPEGEQIQTTEEMEVIGELEEATPTTVVEEIEAGGKAVVVAMVATEKNVRIGEE